MNDDVIHVLFSGPDSVPPIEALLSQIASSRFTLRNTPRLDDVLQNLAEERVNILLLASDAERNLVADVCVVRSNAPDIPVVVMLEPGLETLGLTAVQHGAQDYILVDEITPPLLGRVIRYAIERQRLLRELVRQRVYDDPLTGLPNRLLFLDRLHQAQAHARRYSQLAAVLFLDLDEFKAINDKWGHATGDRLLQMVAQRLSRCIRETDTVARVGGDEFTLVVRDIDTVHQAERVARKVLRALTRSFRVTEAEISISASIGISLYPGDGLDADLLIQKADRAMYRAKERGKNAVQIYDESMNSHPICLDAAALRAVPGPLTF